MSNDAQRTEELAQLLREHRERTASEIRELLDRHLASANAADTDRPTEWGDQVSQHIDDAMDAAALERKSEQLRHIDQAMNRLEVGGYGKCDSCGDPIGTPRLRVLPFVTLCLRCQEEQDEG